MPEQIPSSIVFHQEIEEDSNRKQLSDIQSLKVAFRLSKELAIRNLGLHLGIEGYKLDAIFRNKKDDITEAAHEVIQEWRKRQTSRAEAYKNLLDALTHPDVNLQHVAQEVFGESVILESELGKEWVTAENWHLFCKMILILCSFWLLAVAVTYHETLHTQVRNRSVLSSRFAVYLWSALWVYCCILEYDRREINFRRQSKQ